jgi:uncharacterized phiE125 gp8 family phage protein
MNLIRLAAPDAILGKSEVMARLRMELDDDDAGLDRLIAASTRKAEQFTQRAFATQQWELRLDAFPSCNAAIKLPLPPCQSIQEIKYIDADGVEQTLSDYQLKKDSLCAHIFPGFEKNWPVTRGVVEAVKIKFTCGYGEATAIDDDIVMAVLLLIAHYDMHREAAIDINLMTLPYGVESLLAPHVIPSI